MNLKTEKKKKILILSMAGGFGHIRAGEALLDYAKENLLDIQVEHINVADLNPSLKKYVGRGYELATKKLPFIWAIFYKLPAVFLTAKVMISIRGLFESKIKKYIFEKKPDAIIFTNVVIVPMLAKAIKNMFPNIMIGAVVTDYHGHRYYHFPYIDYYFVANDQVAQDLRRVGIPSDKIIVSGIPINPRFYMLQNPDGLKEKYAIQKNFQVLLLIASFNVSSQALFDFLKQVNIADRQVFSIVVTAGNTKLYEKVSTKLQSMDRVLLVNWTNAMEEYIKMADVVITKAGGLTISECLALGKKMIIVNSILGQEEHNTEFIEKIGLGRRADTLKEAVELLPKMIMQAQKNQSSILPLEHPGQKIFSCMLTSLK